MFIERTMNNSVVVAKLTFIYSSPRLLHGSYADIVTRARFSVRATSFDF